MNIKLVVCDLDGTLLHEDKSLDTGIIDVINNTNSFKLTIASGRNFHIVQDLVKNLHIEIPYILNNGANMWQHDKCLYNANMNRKQLEIACQLLVDNDVSFLAYTNETIYSVGNVSKLGKFMDRLQGKCKLVYNAKIKDFIDESIFKVIMIDPKMSQLKTEINNHCRLLNCVQSEGEIYSLTSIDASKGLTLLKLMDRLNLSKDEVLVFGDNFNDASMFDVATGVAMGNAQQTLKDKAKYVTLSNDEDGVSYFLNNIVLK